MKKPALLSLGPIAAALVIAGCGGGGGGGGSAYGTVPQHKQATAAVPSVDVGHSNLGTFLVDGSGRTLYLFEADKMNTSNCYSSCASLWPPLTTTSTVKAGTSVTASALGTTQRKDGTTEVTYHGHPLYYYAGDGNKRRPDRWSGPQPVRRQVVRRLTRGLQGR